MEQEGGGDEGEDDRDNFSSQIWNMVRAWLLQCWGPVNHKAERRVPGWSKDTGVQCGPSPRTVSSLKTGCLSASFSKCHEWVCSALLCFALPCMQKNCSEYSYAVPNSWMQIADPVGAVTKGETCRRMAWHLELVSNCTQISLLPPVNQLICSSEIYLLNPPGATNVTYLCAA